MMALQVAIVAKSPGVKAIPGQFLGDQAQLRIIRRADTKKDFIYYKIFLELILQQVDSNDEYDVRIADFGLAVFTLKDEKINQKCGTPGYVAPEILRQGAIGYSYKCDIFSLGSVFFNLLTGRYLFGGNSRNEVLRHNERCDLSTKKKYVTSVSENGQNLLFQMLQCDPAQRPTAQECLNHPWFSDDRLILNNLLLFNDFLSNAKPNNGNAKISTLIHASVSSFNLMHIIKNNNNAENQENQSAIGIWQQQVDPDRRYDSFRVASNFFLRLRKEGMDIENRGPQNLLKQQPLLRKTLNDGQFTNMFAQAAIVNNYKHNPSLQHKLRASLGLGAGLGTPLAGGHNFLRKQSKMSMGSDQSGMNNFLFSNQVQLNNNPASREDMSPKSGFEKRTINQSGNIDYGRKESMNSHAIQAKLRSSHRSLSPFNPSVSYHNALHNFKQRQATITSKMREAAKNDDSFESDSVKGGGAVGGGIVASGILKSYHSQKSKGVNQQNNQASTPKGALNEDAMPKKSKFQKRNLPQNVSKNEVPLGEAVPEDSFEYSASNLSQGNQVDPKKEILAELNDIKQRKSHENLEVQKPFGVMRRKSTRRKSVAPNTQKDDSQDVRKSKQGGGEDSRQKRRSRFHDGGMPHVEGSIKQSRFNNHDAHKSRHSTIQRREIIEIDSSLEKQNKLESIQHYQRLFGLEESILVQPRARSSKQLLGIRICLFYPKLDIKYSPVS